jgi:3,4-dihydroxy 2-butanone 4-phosphate synthase/GTP cyclohydrolase II
MVSRNVTTEEGSTVDDALAAIAAGRPVIVVDDEDRENEGDLIMAADAVSAEDVAFFLRHTSGVLCVALSGERLDALELPLMVPAENTEALGTAFTVTVDAREGTTTGISAADRALTIRGLADPSTGPADFNRPGHVFPLRAREGGVLKRAGHTEAALDLARLAGRAPAGLLCEIVTEHRDAMAGAEEIAALARAHSVPVISVAALIRHRRRREKLIRRVSTAELPTPHGPFTAHVYEAILSGDQHFALVRGDLRNGDGPAPLVRVHSECLTGDVFGSRRCDCGEQLDASLERIAAEGRGAVVYLRGHEGRGIGLGHKIAAYALQERGLDTVEANLGLGLPVDSREYGIGAQILVDLGVSAMRLLTNNPDKRGGLEGYGLEVAERLSLATDPTPENLTYLRTKRERMGHLLGELPDEAALPPTRKDCHP